MQTMPWIPDVREDIEHAIEIVPPHWVGDDELYALREHFDLLVFERFADGTLLVTPPPGWKSGGREAELVYQIKVWAHANDPDGLVMTGGVSLPDGSLFGPDATYIASARWAGAEHGKTYAYEVPDAAFEIMSQSDRPGTTMKKIRAYLSNGVRLVVLIDPWRRRVYRGHAADSEPQQLGDVASLDCSPAMPGFTLDVAALMR